jgi:GT2 family glycosyltransferase
VSQILIQCVIVLYKTAPTDSQTISSLIDCCKRKNGLAEQLSILIYDNSPARQEYSPADLPFGAMEYRHDEQNGGLRAAYDYALAKAQHMNIDWLLLLDQDTVLESSLLSALLQEILIPPSSDVCAIVPKLMQNGTMLSPQVVGKLQNTSIFPGFSGISLKCLTALNSASCLRVFSLVKIGGFPREYWLDYLDHALFHRLQAAGGRILVLDVTIQHHLSLVNIETEMSVERYAHVLSAEWIFVREIGWVWGPLVHRLRLLKRGISHFVKLRDKSYALQALRSAFS